LQTSCLDCKICTSMNDMIDLSSPASQASDSDLVPLPAQIENSKSLIKCGIKTRTSKRIEALRRAGRVINYGSPKQNKSPVLKKTAKTMYKSGKKKKKKSNCWHPNGTKKSRRASKQTVSSRLADAQSQTENASPVPTAEATSLHPPQPASVHLHATVVAGVPVANAYYPAPPPQLSFYQKLMALTERIALNPDNHTLDQSECECIHCPYSTGMLSLQRYNLMVRAFQINYVMNSQPHLRDQWS